MLFASIAQDYFRWHYSRAFGELFHLWLNFLWFVIHFFSLPQLARSWFAPWKRMTEARGDGWSFEDLAGFIIINFISRFIGALLRTIIMVIGLLFLAIIICLGLVVYVFWLVAPAAVIVLFALGVTLLVTNFII